MTNLAFAAVLLLLPQDQDAARELRDLIERLGSDVIEERDRASRRLRRLGKAAVPELEKAARGADAETALRASALLRVIEILGRLSPKVKEALPDLEERFLDLENRTEEFVKVAERAWNDQSIAPKDLRELAALAALGARSSDEK